MNRVYRSSRLEVLGAPRPVAKGPHRKLCNVEGEFYDTMLGLMVRSGIRQYEANKVALEMDVMGSDPRAMRRVDELLDGADLRTAKNFFGLISVEEGEAYVSWLNAGYFLSYQKAASRKQGAYREFLARWSDAHGGRPVSYTHLTLPTKRIV